MFQVVSRLVLCVFLILRLVPFCVYLGERVLRMNHFKPRLGLMREGHVGEVVDKEHFTILAGVRASCGGQHCTRAMRSEIYPKLPSEDKSVACARI